MSKKEEAQLDRKLELRHEIMEAIDKLETAEQLRCLVTYWWSLGQIVDRIKEEMDDNWVSQVTIEDMGKDLNHIRKIADNGILDGGKYGSKSS